MLCARFFHFKKGVVHKESMKRDLGIDIGFDNW